MSTFFEDMVKDLSDAIAIEKGELETHQITDSPAPTFIVSDTADTPK